MFVPFISHLFPLQENRIYGWKGRRGVNKKRGNSSSCNPLVTVMPILASPRDTQPPPAAPPLVPAMAYFNTYCQILLFPVREQKMCIKRQKATVATQQIPTKPTQSYANYYPCEYQTMRSVLWVMSGACEIMLIGCMVLCLTHLTITKLGSWLLRVAYICFDHLWYQATSKKACGTWCRERISPTGFRRTNTTNL